MTRFIRLDPDEPAPEITAENLAATWDLIVDEDDYPISSTDRCSVCQLLVRVDSLVLVDGVWRPLVICPSDHREAQE